MGFIVPQRMKTQYMLHTAIAAVQVVVKTANKSVNANQVFANFRYDKETQVNEHNGHTHKEEVKIKQDGEANGWFKYGSREPHSGLAAALFLFKTTSVRPSAPDCALPAMPSPMFLAPSSVSRGTPRRLPTRRTILYASTKSSTGQTRTATAIAHGKMKWWRF